MSGFSDFALGFFAGCPIWVMVGSVETVLYALVREMLRRRDPDERGPK